MTWLLNPRTWLYLGIAAALAFSHAFTYRAGRAAVRAQFDAYKQASAEQAERQREANRGRARDVEIRTVTETVYLERFITRTVKEIEHVTQNLVSCRLDPAAVRLLNDAATCAGENRPATCGPGDGVQPAS